MESLSMKRRMCIALILGLLALLVGIPAVLLVRDVRQQRLNDALIDAIDKNDTPAALTLLDQGADANACSKTNTDIDVWRSLWKRLRYGGQQQRAGRSALVMALFQEDEKVGRGSAENTVLVSALLDHGARINVRDGLRVLKRFPPLYFVAFEGMPNTLRLFLDRGANINAQEDRSGYTALMFAIMSPRANAVPCVRILLEHHADVTIKDSDGKTALTLTRGLYPDDQRTAIIKMLEQAGAK